MSILSHGTGPGCLCTRGFLRFCAFSHQFSPSLHSILFNPQSVCVCVWAGRGQRVSAGWGLLAAAGGLRSARLPLVYRRRRFSRRFAAGGPEIQETTTPRPVTTVKPHRFVSNLVGWFGSTIRTDRPSLVTLPDGWPEWPDKIDSARRSVRNFGESMECGQLSTQTITGTQAASLLMLLPLRARSFAEPRLDSNTQRPFLPVGIFPEPGRDSSQNFSTTTPYHDCFRTSMGR